MMCVYGCRCVCMRYICIFASLFDSFFHVSALEHHYDLLPYIRINIVINNDNSDQSEEFLEDIDSTSIANGWHETIQPINNAMEK